MSTGRIGSGCSSWRGRRTRQLPLIPLVVTADLNLNCSAGVKTCVSGVTVNRAVDGVALMIASSQTRFRASYDGPCLVTRQADCGTIGQDLLEAGDRWKATSSQSRLRGAWRRSTCREADGVPTNGPKSGYTGTFAKFHTNETAARLLYGVSEALWCPPAGDTRQRLLYITNSSNPRLTSAKA